MDKYLWEGGTPAAGCIDVFHHASFWVVGFARELDRGRNETEVPGLILYGGQIAAMQVPLPEILASLALPGEIDPWMASEGTYWRHAIHKYMVCDRKMRGHHLRPGDIPPPGRLHLVEFRSSPKWLPFSDLMLGLERMAVAADVPPGELQFRFHGLPMLDGITLFNAIRAKPREQDELQAELDRWRERSAKLVQAPGIPPPADGDGEFFAPVPSWMRGIRLSRGAFAKYIGRNERQLRRWDALGRVPAGRKWFKPVQTLKGKLKYEVEKNWPAVASLSCRGRDAEKDRHALMALFDEDRADEDDG